MREAQSFDGHRMWTVEAARALHDAPFNDLLFQAQTVHRRNFDPNRRRAVVLAAAPSSSEFSGVTLPPRGWRTSHP